jgi:sugar lactone lactonase YvrE
VVPSELLSAPGSHTVQVLDKDGNPTDVQTFEVVPDVTVDTLIGSNRSGFNAEPCVSGDQALLRRPRRLDRGPDGLIYFTDQQNNAIRTLNPNTREVCTLAGVLGEEGYNDSGNELDKPPTFSFPNGIAVAADGTVYVSENGTSVIRRIVRGAGGITVDTFAGTFRNVNPSRQEKLNSTKEGLEAYRDSSLLDSSFRLPDDMKIASNGTIYIADALNSAIRRITQRDGHTVVETVAGNGVPGFVNGFGRNARFNTPTAIALSPDELFLFVADTNNGRIRRIDLTSGFVDTLAGSGSLNIDDGPPGDAGFIQPIGVAVDSDGTVYVTEIGGNNSRFRDGPGVSAKFAQPRGILIDRVRGVLYVADYENMRIRIIHLR